VVYDTIVQVLLTILLMFYRQVAVYNSSVLVALTSCPDRRLRSGLSYRSTSSLNPTLSKCVDSSSHPLFIIKLSGPRIGDFWSS
jgi:hypothetical protein